MLQHFIELLMNQLNFEKIKLQKITYSCSLNKLLDNSHLLKIPGGLVIVTPDV